MKTLTINIYSFEELSEEAKQTAIENSRPDSNPWQGENYDSLKAFGDVFNLKLSRSYRGFESSDNELTGQRLATWIWNNYRNEIYKPKQFWIYNGTPNCVGANAKHRDSKVFLYNEGACALTGFWMDNEVLKPLFDFMRKPNKRTDFNDLVSECYSAWETACEKDFDFQCSDEMVIENISANGWTFTEDGKMKNG